MVVDIIDIKSMAINHPENNAPVPVDGNRMTASQTAVQRVQPITRQIHVRQGGGGIQPRQNATQFVSMIRPHATMVIRRMQTAQSLVGEGHDHFSIVTCRVSGVKRP
jgi:hypothetical protein